MAAAFKNLLNEAKSGWSDLSVFARFERIVALALMVLSTVVTLFAMARLAYNLFQLFILKADFLEYVVFQSVFGMIMTILIALEFNRSIAATIMGRAHILQVRMVIMIGILALVRKFIILDIKETAPAAVFGLASGVLALACVYWILDQKRTQRTSSEVG